MQVLSPHSECRSTQNIKYHGRTPERTQGRYNIPVCFCRWWGGTTVCSSKSRDTDHNPDLYYFSSRNSSVPKSRGLDWFLRRGNSVLTLHGHMSHQLKERELQAANVTEGASDRIHATGFSRCYKFNYFFVSLMTAFARNTCSYLLELTFQIQSPLTPISVSLHTVPPHQDTHR